MDDRDIILHCVSEIWPAEVSRVSDDLFMKIVDDAMRGIRTPVRRGPGGHNFDLTENVNTIVEAVLLVVELITLLRPWFAQYAPSPTKQRPAVHSEEREVELVAIIIERMKKVEDKKRARDIARLLLNIIDTED